MNKIPVEVSSGLTKLFPFGFLCFSLGKETPGLDHAKYVYGNDEFYISTGYSSNELLERNFQLYDMVEEHDRQKVIDTINQSLNHPETVETADYEVQNPMGERQHLQSRFTVTRSLEGEYFLLITIFNIEYFAKSQESILQSVNKIQKARGMSGVLLKNQPGDAAVIRALDDRVQIADMNQGFMKTMGLNWKVFQNTGGYLDICFPKGEDFKFRQVLEEASHQRGSQQPPKSHEIRVYDGNKELRWFEMKVSFLECREGHEFYIISVWDINERKHIEEQLQVQAEQYKLLKDLTDEYLFSYDVKTNLFVMPKELILKKGLPFEEEEVQYPLQVFLDYIHQDDRELFIERLRDAVHGEITAIIEIRINVAKEGVKPKYEWKRIHYKSITGMYGQIIRVIGRTMDITEEKKEKSILEDKADRDAMTGLWNKTATEEKVQEFISGVKSGVHAMLVIDIDDFKQINDSFGHLYGDTVIRSIADNIQKLFRNTDIVGRIGGDEFLVLMKNVTSELAVAVAEDVCAEVSTVIRNEQEDVRIGCSIGVALYPKNGTTYQSLFKKAELAMYQVKATGKGTCKLAEKWIPNLAETVEYKSKRQAEYGIVKNLTPEFTSYCFGLLAETKNVDSAINIILQRIGELSGYGAVILFEFNKTEKSLTSTNRWTRKEGISELPQKSFSELDWILQKFDEDGIYAVNDCLDDCLDEIDKACYRSGTHQIYAILYSRFNGNINTDGCLCVQDMDKPRIWTNQEKESLKELSHLLSIFSLLRKQTDEDRKETVRMKNCDYLTGLILEEVFVEKVNQARQCAVNKLPVIAYADIDGFSYVNENFGIQAGNQLLKEFARLIWNENNEAIVSRVFTDFFVMYFQVDCEKDAITLLNRIEQNFFQKARKYYPSGNLRLSTGAYFCKDPEITTTIAIENANFARKKAKSIGPGLLAVYDEEMRDQRNYDQMVAGEFHKALEEGRIEMFLQPKFVLEDYTIYGAEALARWRNPNGELRQPQHFIPQLERIGYITELDFYLYEQVLRRISWWRKNGMKVIPVSVNFSRRHFDMDGFFEKVKELADRYQVPHELVEIELTESLLSQRQAYVIQQMQLLREDGFMVAIDDFGTGYSSLSMLIDIPADVVKIDKSFLHRDDLEERRRFIYLLGELVRSTDESLICEGIETEEQVTFLKDCGFLYGQGFLVDRPIPALEFESKYIFNETGKV